MGFSFDDPRVESNGIRCNSIAIALMNFLSMAKFKLTELSTILPYNNSPLICFLFNYELIKLESYHFSSATICVRFMLLETTSEAQSSRFSTPTRIMIGAS